MSSPNTRVISILCHVMRPIVRMALRNGVVYRDFMHACKALYVEISSEHNKMKTGKTNYSKVFVETGIDRKEIKRMMDAEIKIKPNASTSNKAISVSSVARVITGWRQSSYYSTEQGEPIELSINTTEPSFSSLVAEFGDGAPVDYILGKLKNEGVIAEVNGKLKLLKGHYIPTQDPEESFKRFGDVINNVFNTIFYNLNQKSSQPRLFERRVTNCHIDSRYVDDYRRFLSEIGQNFLNEIDDWLSLHEIREPERDESEAICLGLGVYWIQEDNDTNESEIKRIQV